MFVLSVKLQLQVVRQLGEWVTGERRHVSELLGIADLSDERLGEVLSVRNCGEGSLEGEVWRERYTLAADMRWLGQHPASGGQAFEEKLATCVRDKWVEVRGVAVHPAFQTRPPQCLCLKSELEGGEPAEGGDPVGKPIPSFMTAVDGLLAEIPGTQTIAFEPAAGGTVDPNTQLAVAMRAVTAAMQVVAEIAEKVDPRDADIRTVLRLISDEDGTRARLTRALLGLFFRANNAELGGRLRSHGIEPPLNIDVDPDVILHDGDDDDLPPECRLELGDPVEEG